MKTTLAANRALAVIPAALLTLPLLVGCTPAAQGMTLLSDGCVAPGNASESIEALGDFGADLELQDSISIKALGLQRTVLEVGEGKTVADGDTFVGQLNIFVGSTGEPYTQEFTRHVFDSEALAPWYFDTVRCASAGDRIASAVPAADLLGAGGGADLGISDDDTMAVVVDIRAVLSAEGGQAAGAAGELPAGFPLVSRAEDGTPTLSVPADLAGATSFAAAPSIVGAGPKVEEDDTVLMQYQGRIARTGEIFEQSWGGAAVTFPLAEVNPGFRAGLVGQTVGSQVVIIVPPGTGYSAEDLVLLGHQSDDVMVYLVDILDAG